MGLKYHLVVSLQLYNIFIIISAITNKHPFLIINSAITYIYLFFIIISVLPI